MRPLIGDRHDALHEEPFAEVVEPVELHREIEAG